MMHPLQATAVAIGGRALLIEGAPGSGKSTLALALIDRGAQLIGDDGVMIEVRAQRLIVSPHPNTRGLIEVRNLGILTMPASEKVPLALVIGLDPLAPRFIEQAAAVEHMGIALPSVGLWPDSPALVIKAELALRKFGLPTE
jgi:hypothetical protein